MQAHVKIKISLKTVSEREIAHQLDGDMFVVVQVLTCTHRRINYDIAAINHDKVNNRTTKNALLHNSRKMLRG